MSIRVRKDGTMWCSAHTKEEPGDTYIDDGLHYEMSVETGVIVALPMPEHVDHPQWWWIAQAPAECNFRGRTESGRMPDNPQLAELADRLRQIIRNDDGPIKNPNYETIAVAAVRLIELEAALNAAREGK